MTEFLVQYVSSVVAPPVLKNGNLASKSRRLVNRIAECLFFQSTGTSSHLLQVPLNGIVTDKTDRFIFIVKLD